MCPACISTVALAVAGLTSTGGLAALLTSRLRAGKVPKKEPHRSADGSAERPMIRATEGD
ncbi:MAG: hypothetical protein QOD06_2953 [Candidatus Binatota bacterium]|nr:hypothetical protein [Candidatus Binatota bacterium]